MHDVKAGAILVSLLKYSLEIAEHYWFFFLGKISLRVYYSFFNLLAELASKEYLEEFAGLSIGKHLTDENAIQMPLSLVVVGL